MAPTVFTYSGPKIEYMTAGIKFSDRCNDEATFIFKHRVLSVDRRGDEILIFLTENQIVQLVDLSSVRDTYDSIINWLTSGPATSGLGVQGPATSGLGVQGPATSGLGVQGP